MTTQRSIRLSPISSASLGASSGASGEVFFDQTNKTLRLFDGRTKGGFQLLRADLSNITGSFGVTVSASPPSSAQQGSQWINSNTGVLYIYYVDTNGGHWIQPVTSPVGVIEPPVTLQSATTYSLGAVQVDGTSIIVAEDGTISAVASTSFTNSNFIGVTTTYMPSSVLNTIDGADGVVVHDISVAGTTFYHTNPTGNFTANFTNIPTTNNRSTSVNLIIAQNNPACLATSVQINGTPVNIDWAGGLQPTGHIGNTDVMSFTLLRVNNQWTVTGSLSTHGAI